MPLTESDSLDDGQPRPDDQRSLDQPKVSVLIASYNHARYLPKTLDSVLGQTFQNFEVVIVDDGSTDESLSIVEDYASRYPAVRVLTHPGKKNKGISATCNLALEHARGEFLSWLGSDDMWYPNMLETQVALLESDPALGLVYSYARLIDETDEQLSDDLIGWDITGEAAPLELLAQSSPVPTLTAVFRHKCIKQVGPFDEQLVYSDWELWIRIAAHWRIGFSAAPLAMYRVHHANVSIGIKPELNLRYALDVLQAVSRKSRKIGGALLAPRTQALLHLRTAYLASCLQDEDESQRSLANVFSSDPSLLKKPETLAGWLMRQARMGFNTRTLPIRDTAVQTNLLAHLRLVAGNPYARRVKRLIAAREAAQTALDCHKSDLPRARQMIVKCLLNDPRQLITQRLGLVILKSVLGETAFTRLRYLTKKSQSS